MQQMHIGVCRTLLSCCCKVATLYRPFTQGIAGHGFYDDCVVPIIENTARECELTGRLREAIAAYPRANAVLVRRHGIYIWGDTWLQARRLSPRPRCLIFCQGGQIMTTTECCHEHTRQQTR